MAPKKLILISGENEESSESARVSESQPFTSLSEAHSDLSPYLLLPNFSLKLRTLSAATISSLKFIPMSTIIKQVQDNTQELDQEVEVVIR
ncbi:hypothetical protein E2C01_055001 [Portunus trituberculatus]|uniref:Uncharacterized protein n=1 Tax=Portunus trituberculatus TaxID=210409 RepID=A0A5B7GTF8_PORTR|nr:hypothetical protein [Portunus trituberculatus]